MPTVKKAILIGAGDRGNIYAAWARKNPGRLVITGVAEPDDYRRERAARLHNIDPRRRFDGWEGILSEPIFADAAIIATPDRLHLAPALKALEKGYHLLIEKPVALTAEDCRAIAASAFRKKPYC